MVKFQEEIDLQSFLGTVFFSKFACFILPAQELSTRSLTVTVVDLLAHLTTVSQCCHM